MTLQIEQDFSPDGLAGHARTGLFVLDKAGCVVLFNRAACRLTGVPPETLFGQSLPLERVRNWLESPPVSKLTLKSPVGTLEYSLAGTSESMRLVSVIDVAPKLALAQKTKEFESATGNDWKGWNARARAISVLQLFREYAERPQDLSGIADLARLTGGVLFPQGGEITVLATENPFFRWTWGPATTHDVVEIPFASGSVSLNGPLDDVSTDASALFVQTLDYALLNLDR